MSPITDHLRRGDLEGALIQAERRNDPQRHDLLRRWMRGRLDDGAEITSYAPNSYALPLGATVPSVHHYEIDNAGRPIRLCCEGRELEIVVSSTAVKRWSIEILLNAAQEMQQQAFDDDLPLTASDAELAQKVMRELRELRFALIHEESLERPDLIELIRVLYMRRAHYAHAAPLAYCRHVYVSLATALHALCAYTMPSLKPPNNRYGNIECVTATGRLRTLSPVRIGTVARHASEVYDPADREVLWHDQRVILHRALLSEES